MIDGMNDVMMTLGYAVFVTLALVLATNQLKKRKLVKVVVKKKKR